MKTFGILLVLLGVVGLGAGMALLQSDEVGDYFVPESSCVGCHARMTASDGRILDFGVEWRTSTMAQSATDPYWQASVRKESMANPALTPVIQAVCATCHMPMARVTALAGDTPVMVLDEGFKNPAHPLHAPAMEGISCTLCHQIQPDNLGEHASFDGGYLIDLEKPLGARELFGSYAIDNRANRMMANASGFVGVQSDHLGDSALCATCHTLYTPFLDENDEIGGLFPEQMAYIEWEHSRFVDDKTCQDCHMPALSDVAISGFSSNTYTSVKQHVFVGSNAYLLALLNETDSGIVAAEWDLAMQLSADFMATQTATLSFGAVGAADGVLTADVVIDSLSGHKLPTGFPSRRVWVHFTVTDAAGNVVFESGGYGDDGMIYGNANDSDPAVYEPHYTVISSGDEVQIYESIMVDTLGVPTTTLLRGSRYIKDNRILPQGFDKASALPDIAVHGAASDDADFTGGQDTITYRVALDGAEGPFTVSAALLYQSISFRWAMDLQGFVVASDTVQEIDTFLTLYAQVPNLPVMIASVETQAE